MSDEELYACGCDGCRPVELADSLEIQRDFNDAFNSEREVAEIRISPWDRIFLQEMADDLAARLQKVFLKGTV